MKGKLSRGDIRHLHELAGMKEKGVLTAEEFSRHKSAVLEAARTEPVRRRTTAPWLIAAVAALLIVGVAIIISSGRSIANQADETAGK